MKDKLEIGQEYILTFTHPMYDKHEQKYLPDNFRFVDPDIVTVFYGGHAGKDVSRYCAVCGRKGANPHQFLDIETGKELFISDHCLAHDSTQQWRTGTKKETIEEWYREECLRRDAEGGDSMAGLVLALRDLEDDPYD